jgi:hypothetical protein
VADGVRTRDLLDHNQALYQAELRPPCSRRAVVACRLRSLIVAMRKGNNAHARHDSNVRPADLMSATTMSLTWGFAVVPFLPRVSCSVHING